MHAQSRDLHLFGLRLVTRQTSTSVTLPRSDAFSCSHWQLQAAAKIANSMPTLLQWSSSDLDVPVLVPSSGADLGSPPSCPQIVKPQRTRTLRSLTLLERTCDTAPPS